MTWGRPVALIVALATLAPGCATGGLALRADGRVRILGPGNGDHVTLPFTVRWDVEDDGLASMVDRGDARFAVFFDASPMAAGASIRDVVGEVCRKTPGCPDASFLRARSIFLTGEPQLEVAQLANGRDSHHRADTHDLVIVVVSPDGRRLGEAAYRREFVVDRSDS